MSLIQPYAGTALIGANVSRIETALSLDIIRNSLRDMLRNSGIFHPPVDCLLPVLSWGSWRRRRGYAPSGGRNIDLAKIEALACRRAESRCQCRRRTRRIIDTATKLHAAPELLVEHIIERRRHTSTILHRRSTGGRLRRLPELRLLQRDPGTRRHLFCLDRPLNQRTLLGIRREPHGEFAQLLE